MARGRMIDKRVSQSKKIGRCSDKGRNLWFMICPHLDRDGRIGFADLEDLRTEIIPHFSWAIKIIAKGLNELADLGLIHLFPDKKYAIAIEYVRFEDFQQGLRYERESESLITPYGETPDNAGIFRFIPDKSGNKPLSLSLRKFKEGRKESKEDIAFDFDQGNFLFISEKDKEIWKKAYPACDINLCLHQMAAWLLANPNKKKENYKRFIVNWLTKEQQRGGTRRTFQEDKHKAAREGTLKQFRDGEITYEEIVEISKKYNEPLLLEEAEKIRGSKK